MPEIEDLTRKSTAVGRRLEQVRTALPAASFDDLDRRIARLVQSWRTYEAAFEARLPVLPTSTGGGRSFEARPAQPRALRAGFAQHERVDAPQGLTHLDTVHARLGHTLIRTLIDDVVRLRSDRHRLRLSCVELSFRLADVLQEDARLLGGVSPVPRACARFRSVPRSLSGG